MIRLRANPTEIIRLLYISTKLHIKPNINFTFIFIFNNYKFI